MTRLQRLILTYPLALGVPGGGTVHCIELARALAAAGVGVSLFPVAADRLNGFLQPRLNPPHAWPRAMEGLRAAGVNVTPVEPSPFHYIFDSGRVRRAVSSALAVQPADAILGFHHEMWRLGNLRRRRRLAVGMLAAAERYDVFPGGAIGRRVRGGLVLRSLRQADVVFANSGYIAGELAAAGIPPAKVRVAHPGVHPAFFGAAREGEPAGQRLVFAGSMYPPKGVFDLLEALGSLRARDWQLTIVGWGERAPVEAAISRWGLGGRCELRGYVSREELVELYRQSDAAVLPSYIESFGLAVAEAQAAGLPVIAYAAGAVPEIVVAGETGWLVPLRDTAALAGAICEALDAPAEARQRGLAGAARARAHFRWEHTAHTVLRGLEEAGLGTEA
jgi:glycosyltransferase involved in cell wall biosynthesis